MSECWPETGDFHAFARRQAEELDMKGGWIQQTANDAETIFTLPRGMTRKTAEELLRNNPDTRWTAGRFSRAALVVGAYKRAVQAEADKLEVTASPITETVPDTLDTPDVLEVPPIVDDEASVDHLALEEVSSVAAVVTPTPTLEVASPTSPAEVKASLETLTEMRKEAMRRLKSFIVLNGGDVDAFRLAERSLLLKTSRNNEPLSPYEQSILASAVRKGLGDTIESPDYRKKNGLGSGEDGVFEVKRFEQFFGISFHRKKDGSHELRSQDPVTLRDIRRFARHQTPDQAERALYSAIRKMFLDAEYTEPEDLGLATACGTLRKRLGDYRFDVIFGLRGESYVRGEVQAARRALQEGVMGMLQAGGGSLLDREQRPIIGMLSGVQVKAVGDRRVLGRVDGMPIKEVRAWLSRQGIQDPATQDAKIGGSFIALCSATQKQRQRKRN